MKDKSVVLALVLTFFLGPVGLLYASVAGALALIVFAAAAVVPTMGFCLIFVWPASMAWGVIAASNKHKAFVREASVSPTDQSHAPELVNLHPRGAH